MSSQISRRDLVKGIAGAATVASTAFHAPHVIARQSRTPVVFWTSFTAQSLEVQQRIVDEFNAQSHDVEVSLEQIPPGEVTDSSRLITAVRGGTGPDVYNLDRFIVPERAANGLLQDLSNLLEENGASANLADTHLEFAANEATYEGSPFALPFQTDVRALYYNKTILADAGVDIEPFDPNNGVLTWDVVKEAGFAANIDTASGDNFEQMGFVPWFNQGWHYTYGFSWGADFFDEDACEVTPNSDEMIAASQWVYDYAAELNPSKAAAFIQASMRPGAPPQESPWTQGRLGILVSNGQQIALNESYAPDLDYGITYLPVPEEGMESSTWAGGWSMVIPEGAQQPDAAIKFMLFACGEPGQRIYAEDNQALPTLASLLEERDLFGDRLFFAEELLADANNRPPLPVGARYWDDLTSAWEQIYLNQEDPETALTTAKESTMTLLDQYCPIA